MSLSLFENRTFDAFLFDMDGTILSSIAAAERVWAAWARSHKLDVDTFLPTIHGVRAAETIARQDLPGIDLQAEVDALTAAEMEDVGGIEPIAGAAAFLASLPRDRWAIVTSATRELAAKRLAAAGLPLPPMMVAGDDVAHGKPAPDCFLLGAQRLGFAPGRCLVFEDAPAGIQAAEAAGMPVLIVSALHRHRMETPHPDFTRYDELSLDHGSDGLALSRVAPRPAA